MRLCTTQSLYMLDSVTSSGVTLGRADVPYVKFTSIHLTQYAHISPTDEDMWKLIIKPGNMSHRGEDYSSPGSFSQRTELY